MTLGRPGALVLVTGTGTGVGKTWVAARALTALRAAGCAVAARKPVQSYGPDEGPTDAEVLAAATGEVPAAVCPPHRAYELALAPPMAAEALGRAAFTIGELVAETTWPTGLDVGIVEGAGGPRSPLAGDGDTVDLAHALEPDLVVLVGDPGLGTINAVRLAAGALAGHPLVVVLNRFDATDGLHRRNRDWLAQRDRWQVVTEVRELVVRLDPRSAGSRDRRYSP
ncbi:MAG: dethiobiotin synthase [Acidimicrobiia bacterium]|nr:dethiobiotin synthase [Acidimicrobiia bacterium]